MRKTIFILNIIFSTFIIAQNSESLTKWEREYNDILSYIPKNIKIDSINRPESRFLKGKINSIGSLKMYNNFRDGLKFSIEDKLWLENRIRQIATALFLDGKKILITAVGGYSGCPEKMIDTIKLNNIEITNLKFCHGCTDSYRDKNFINIFNSKMYSLMEIEPPNGKTYRFYGKFISYSKNNNGIELILTDDRTFKFWKRKGHGSDFTEGLWKNRNDTLILNSNKLTLNDSLTFALSNKKWIEFNDLKFRLKKQKLTELNKGKRKLKKIVD